ncbi:MAG: DNA polymerase, partial [Thermoplasmata archaeon]
MKEMGVDNWLIFENKEKLKEFLLNKKPETYIFVGHNILNFDIFTIFTMDEILNNFDIVMNGSQILQMHSTVKRIYFFDTYQIYRTSLKELGKMIGLKKGDLQEELKIIDKDEFYKRKNEIIEYCKMDVAITEKIFEYYFNKVKEIKNIKKPKSIPFTSAMYSFSYFNYLNDYKINGKNMMNDNLFLESYYGGRTENFYSGNYKDKIYVYDVNSLYPYAMKIYDYPIEFYKDIYGDKLNNKDLLNEYINNYEGLALVKVKSFKGLFGFEYNNKFIDIGLLPLKRKIDNAIKLIFP